MILCSHSLILYFFLFSLVARARSLIRLLQLPFAFIFFFFWLLFVCSVCFGTFANISECLLFIFIFFALPYILFLFGCACVLLLLLSLLWNYLFYERVKVQTSYGYGYEWFSCNIINTWLSLLFLYIYYFHLCTTLIPVYISNTNYLKYPSAFSFVAFWCKRCQRIYNFCFVKKDIHK